MQKYFHPLISLAPFYITPCTYYDKPYKISGAGQRFHKLNKGGTPAQLPSWHNFRNAQNGKEHHQVTTREERNLRQYGRASVKGDSDETRFPPLLQVLPLFHGSFETTFRHDTFKTKDIACWK